MYYFAYGTNMSIEHMRRLCGRNFEILGLATLPDHEFLPDLRGFASVTPKQGAKVFGVLYKVDQHCIDAMDEYEGYPEVFGRKELQVIDSSGQQHKAEVYVETPEQLGGTYIKDHYLRRIIAGALENRLPEEWISFLESFMPK